MIPEKLYRKGMPQPWLKKRRDILNFCWKTAPTGSPFWIETPVLCVALILSFALRGRIALNPFGGDILWSFALSLETRP
jgi:hypothetical protein